MDNNEKNNDSLNSMNSLFGTNITVNNKPQKTEEKKTEDTSSVNTKQVPLQPKIEIDNKKDTPPKQENIENIKEDKEDLKQVNEEATPSDNIKPILEPVIPKPENKDNEENIEQKESKDINKVNENKPLGDNKGLISELIDTVEHFNLSNIKVNLASIGFAISLIGSVIYNLIIALPGAIICYLSYKKSLEGIGTKEDKLLAILGIALSICCILSLLITKVSSLFY